VGFGGHHLGDAPDERTAVRLVRQAVDGRVTFFDNCWEYHRGKTEAWMGAGLDGVRDRVFLMTKVQRHPHKHSAISPFRYPEMLPCLQSAFVSVCRLPMCLCRYAPASSLLVKPPVARSSKPISSAPRVVPSGTFQRYQIG
jgi:Aldo/keto reductase family